MKAKRSIKRWIPLVVMLLLATGCGLIPEVTLQETNDPPTELNVWLLEGSGLEKLIDQYQLAHPELSIHIQTSTYEELPNKLQTAFAAGYSSPDVAMLEVDFMERFKLFPDSFYNLLELGAADLEGQYLDWKWGQALSADQSFLFGLPTDIGPYAMIYRKDLFALAGLPMEPEDVSAAMDTWDKFLAAGQTLLDKTNTAFINDLESLYRTILNQAELQYYDRTTGELIIETNPAVKRAWDYAIKAYQLNLSANLSIKTARWSKGLPQDFAVMLCPSWLVSSVKNSAPQANGLWNIAEIPEGFVNRGGSFLSLPKTGSHPEEAFALMKWLTSPEQQLETFKLQGTFPSIPSIYENSVIRDYTDPYFLDAPIGQIYAEAALQIKPTYAGPGHVRIQTEVLKYLKKVEDEKIAPDEAWDQMINEVRRLDINTIP